MDLNVKPVSKCLDKKLMLLGFEVFDLVAIFVLLGILNLIFGDSENKLITIWLPTLIVTSILKFGKKGKPDNYLIHLARFQFSPGVYSAFAEPTHNPFPPKKGKNHE